MGKTASIPHYSPAEEMLNVASHVIGFVLSIIAIVALLERALALGNTLYLISVGIFGFSDIALNKNTADFIGDLFAALFVEVGNNYFRTGSG